MMNNLKYCGKRIGDSFFDEECAEVQMSALSANECQPTKPQRIQGGKRDF